MNNKKDFDKYAADLFGDGYGKKNSKSVGLSNKGASGNSAHPQPLDVLVYDKNQNIMTPIKDKCATLTEIETNNRFEKIDLSLDFISEESDSEATANNWRYKQRERSKSIHDNESILMTKRSKGDGDHFFRESQISFDSGSENDIQDPNENIMAKRLTKKAGEKKNESDSDLDLRYFCVDHMQICKSRVEKHKHRKCQVDVLDDRRSSSLSSSLSGRTGSVGSIRLTKGMLAMHTINTDKLEKLYDYSGLIIQDREEVKQHLCARKSELREQFYSFMEDFITHILKRKKAFLARLEEFHQDNTKRVSQQVTQLHKLRHESKLAFQTLQLPSTFDDFEKYREVIETAKQRTSVLQEITRKLENSIYKWEYEFKPNPVVDAICDLEHVGHITTCPDTPLLPPFLSLKGTDVDSEPNLNTEETNPLLALELCTCIEGTEKGELPTYGFTGTDYVTTDALLLADWNNGVIKMLNILGVVMDTLAFGKSPWDVTHVCDGQAAVTVPDLQTVFFVECDTHLRIVDSFNTRCECFGICKLNDNFVITCDPWRKSPSVRIFSKRGILLSCFQLNNVGENIFKCPMHVCADYFKTLIYVSDATADCVFAFSLMGEIRFVYEHQELRYPTGLATDRNNCLYICGKDSVNIHQVSNSGKLMDINVRQRHGMFCPRTICFHPDGELMVITDAEGPNANGILKRKLL